MFLKLNTSLIPNNLADVAESPVWNTLIPSRLELPEYIDDPRDNENEEDDDDEEKEEDDDNDDDDEDDDLSLVPIESDEVDYAC